MFMKIRFVITSIITIVAILCCTVSAGSTALEMKAVEAQDGVDIFAGGKLFTSYKTGAAQKYPYFYPVNGPASGLSVTTESSDPYPHHHSLFFGCDRVNGGNYWQDSLEAGQICSTALKIVVAAGQEVVIENECEWRKPGETPVFLDRRRVRVFAPKEDLRVIDFDIVLIPQLSVTIERTNHSLFSARMTPALSVTSGGVLTNASGETGEKGTFGKASPWCDYHGVNGHVREGLAILQHPENPLYPAQWFTRDYGFFSPTPLYWPPNESHIELGSGERVSLRYRVLVHTGTTAEAGIQELHAAYAGTTAPVSK